MKGFRKEKNMRANPKISRLAYNPRNRVARELHDSVNQSIFSITLTAEAARTMLDRDPARVSSYLDQLQEMTANALAQLRSLIGQLRPKVDELIHEEHEGNTKELRRKDAAYH